MNYIKRNLEKVINEVTKEYPVVLVTGSQFFELLDKSSTPRSKGAVICMKPGLSSIDRNNYIVPIWMI